MGIACTNLVYRILQLRQAIHCRGGAVARVGWCSVEDGWRAPECRVGLR